VVSGRACSLGVNAPTEGQKVFERHGAGIIVMAKQMRRLLIRRCRAESSLSDMFAWRRIRRAPANRPMLPTSCVLRLRPSSCQPGRQTPHRPKRSPLHVVCCLAKALPWRVMLFTKRVSLQSASDARRRVRHEVATRRLLAHNRCQRYCELDSRPAMY
jgi:hypothetical protein